MTNDTIESYARRFLPAYEAWFGHSSLPSTERLDDEELLSAIQDEETLRSLELLESWHAASGSGKWDLATACGKRFVGGNSADSVHRVGLELQVRQSEGPARPGES